MNGVLGMVANMCMYMYNNYILSTHFGEVVVEVEDGTVISSSSCGTNMPSPSHHGSHDRLLVSIMIHFCS